MIDYTKLNERIVEQAEEAAERQFDPVIDALQGRIDALWKITEGNMRMRMMNIMDDIRLDHIDKLREAMKMWENR
jgi:hypothetical protein